MVSVVRLFMSWGGMLISSSGSPSLLELELTLELGLVLELGELRVKS